jgi:subtilase family serine protease
MHCNGWIRTDIHPAVSGFGPAQLQSAYGVTSAALTNGANQTIAVVDPFDDPNAESDLGIYRSLWALPACTTANGCFMRVNHNGIAGSYPPTDPTGGWEGEESLDLDMASAICPNCEIVLVEALSASNTDLYAAEDTAASVCGATEISNSWDGSEYTGEMADETHFNHGVPITVAGGDNGYVSNTVTGTDGYPASSAHVTTVGGTKLVCSPACSETVWSMTGSGCSQMIAQPTWQAPYHSACTMRIFNDVSAVGDPNTPVAFYDSFHSGGWGIAGGTSVGTPIIAGVYALAGGGVGDAHLPYSHASSLHDIVSGSNGSCGSTLMCTAKVGYDAPTGIGTPNGIGGF